MSKIKLKRKTGCSPSMTVLRKCRVCGSTQNNACRRGCYWVANNLCSRCMKYINKQERLQLIVQLMEDI